MEHSLSNTPVAQNAQTIFASVAPGNVLLLSADMGSGKSLYTPYELHQRLDGPVLVLAPTVDVVRDNAARMAEIFGWELGRKIGFAAGGEYLPGTHVMLATYGAFVRQPWLRKLPWAAIQLDESHVEQLEVELARGDVYGMLKDGLDLFVCETSATMNQFKLEHFWQGVAPHVVHHHIEGAGTTFNRDFIEQPAMGADPVDTLTQATMERLAAGDRFIMVTQPGQIEVEKLADEIERTYEISPLDLPTKIEIAVYHGDTDPEDIDELLADLVGDEAVIIVTTPRLLTGFNHNDLQTVITDGVAKYPYSDHNGGFQLRRKPMSQAELTQASGRVGRFQDGQLLLVSDISFDERLPTVIPEVERLSSLPFVLDLLALGRDPTTITFCNQPRDLDGSMELLRDWGFADADNRITKLGRRAHKLDLRPDLAKFVLSMGEGATNPLTYAKAIALAAVMESGTVAKFRPRDENGNEIRIPNYHDRGDYFNELLRFAKAAQQKRSKRKESGWVSEFRFNRIKRTITKLVKALNDDRLTSTFGGILAEDTRNNGKGRQTNQASPWVKLGTLLENFKRPERLLISRQFASQLTPARLYQAVEGHRGGLDGQTCSGDTVQIGNQSATSVDVGEYFFAAVRTIEPAHGGPAFDVLVDVLPVSAATLRRGRPDVYDQAGEDMVTVNGESFPAIESYMEDLVTDIDSSW